MTGTGPERPGQARRLGSYELLQPIAHGGMAEIFLARRAGTGPLERHVAVKVLSAHRATEAETCAMFLDEARVCAMLDHQNIASVLEVDVIDGEHFIAMEYVHGVDLRELLAAATRAHRALPYEASLAIVAAAALGLDHAHRRCGPDGKPLRLVHRDVSLSNIMVGHDGAVKVVDFGIAKTTIATTHTSPGVVRGKASYMSPEQCLGDRVDHRTDVFALGIVLYELTTGLRCFRGTNDFERMLAVVRGDFLAPTQIVHDYPIELEQVVRCALAADPAQRFPSAAAMIEAIERVRRGRGWNADTGSIARLMQELYGPGAEPGTPGRIDPELTSKEAPSARRVLDAASPPHAPAPATRGAPRLARGTSAACCSCEEDDQPTRGRRPLRRHPTAPALAA